ncbi:hypothetical protein RHGRI_003714 [Rhododendron griersonianum]|uniref:Uncharacterized protein n=1 Tax=Rhododendron griersonianum TaxID=479676 RepID=A0AAV6L610_9ERIC|nr:hypothetical protein RHGRI_003714 [Rhododendron griersonianum]
MISEHMDSKTVKKLTGRSNPTYSTPRSSSAIFYWGSKDRIFAVYDRKLLQLCKFSENPNPNCYWVARPDSFYISSDNKTWMKENEWIEILHASMTIS